MKAVIVALCLLGSTLGVYGQGTVTPTPIQTFFTNPGAPCANCRLYTYVAGSVNTDLATYSDEGLATELPNPITLNSAGRPTTGAGAVTPIYLSQSSYKFVLTTSGGTTVWSADHVPAIPAQASALDVEGTAGENLIAGDAVYLTDGSGGQTAGRWYKTDADNTYGSTTAGMVGVVPGNIDSGESGSIRLQGRITGLSALTAGAKYYASATAGGLTATPPTNARFIAEADSTTSIVVGGNPGAVRMPDSNGTHSLVIKTTSDLTADRLFTLVPGDAARTATFSGSPTLGDVSLSAGAWFDTANTVIRRNTADASDNGSITQTGGGASGTARGGEIVTAGNEHATLPGYVSLNVGNVANSRVRFMDSAGAAMFTQLGADGTTTFTSAAGPAWIYNSTAGSGGYASIQRSGANRLTFGDAVAMAVTSSTNGDGAVNAAAGNLSLESGADIKSLTAYGRTDAGAANVVILASGAINRSTSSARYKINLAPLGDWRWFLSLQPRRFNSLTDPNGRTYGGFLAEDVAQWSPRGIDGRPLFAGLDAEGRPDDVAYPHLTAVAQQGLVAHEDRLNKQLDLIAGIEARLGALEAENAALRAQIQQIAVQPSFNGVVVSVPAGGRP